MAFSGKVVIVTGSSSGIGREIAVLFVERGASVTVHGRDAEKLKETVAQLNKAGADDSRIHAVLGPIEEEDTRERLIEGTVAKFGHLDVLVNNAGIFYKTGVDSRSLPSLEEAFKVNLNSAIDLTRKAVIHLEKTKGNVVNIGALTAEKAASAFAPQLAHSLSKAALEHYTRNAALQYGDEGIRVNTVSPGIIAGTEFMSRHGVPSISLNMVAKRHSAHTVPLRRLGTPRDVANVVGFLASDEAAYVTGANFAVDGGASAGVPNPLPL